MGPTTGHILTGNFVTGYGADSCLLVSFKKFDLIFWEASLL